MALRFVSIVACVAAAALAGACGRAESPAPTVTLDSPAAGDTVRGPAVHVTLSLSGIELAPAADARPGTAHHHLYLDADVGPLDEPIPFAVPGVVHLGQGQSEYHWDSVAPGEHRIIAVLADWRHVPLADAATDTVRFVVVPR